MFLLTIRKSGAIHVCPAFTNLPQTILLEASLKSIVSSIIQGFFPPSSSVVGVRCFAAAAATIFPILTLPVKNM